ncbi:MAG: helix-turn-helix domain-containing protein [Planctomycetaceae bacterium]|nr:helix-turn-helix domain-containing protein [Planctomycetaceae bacterium]
MTNELGELRPPLINSQRACELLGIKSRKLFNLTKSGALTCVRLAGRGKGAVRYDLADIEAFIAASKETGRG